MVFDYNIFYETSIRLHNSTKSFLCNSHLHLLSKTWLRLLKNMVLGAFQVIKYDKNYGIIMFDTIQVNILIDMVHVK